MSVINSIKEKLLRENFEGVLITSAVNRRYVSEFTGSAGVVIITKDRQLFLTDFRYERQALDQVKGFEQIIYKNSASLKEELVNVIHELGLTNLVVEAETMSVEFYDLLDRALPVKLIKEAGFISSLRAVKSEDEIQKIKKAAQITDEAFKRITSFIEPGLRELDIANMLEFTLKDLGADFTGGSMVVASGPRGALPHGRPSERTVQNNEMVTLDFGAIYQGYHADMTRTVKVGGAQQEKLLEIYQIVFDALAYAKEHIAVGMSGTEVDQLTRLYIAERGFGEYFGHGSGHGIGLAIHEDPFFSTISTDELKENMVVTIEPGIYLPDIGGVRLEDNLVIKANGKHEIITQSPLEMEIN